MVIASALFLSTSGVGLRVIEEASAWQILFYRSISMMALVLVVLVFVHRRSWRSRFQAITKDDILLAFVLGSGFVAYVFALLTTTVANALFIFSAAPFLAAVLGWCLLGERVPLRTSIAIGGAMAGLGIMVGTGMAQGRYLGNLIALWLPISYAIAVVVVRRSRQPDMLVALLLAAFVATFLSLLFVEQLSISWWDFGVSVYLGVFQVGLGFTLLILGARYVPAAQVGLLALLEPVLGPIWAWLTVTEIPTAATLWGGLIILSAVAIDAGFSALKGASDRRAGG
tara:strand:+ start:78 stop:929 length:852 start_codon:yes stop_codon:yes gene_type:complete